MSKPLAIIPARGGSKRFPRKNVAPLGGKPLIAWAIEAAKGSEVFDCVCVSSEDEEILRVAKDSGADLALRRPAELASDTAQTKHVCMHLLEEFKKEGKPYEAFALLMPTSPLRNAADIRAAYAIFREHDCESVMSIVPCDDPPQQTYKIVDGLLVPYFGVEAMHIRSQELEPAYRHDGSITFIKSAVFLRRQEWVDTGVVPYSIPPERSVDIDAPHALAWAEFLLTHS